MKKLYFMMCLFCLTFFMGTSYANERTDLAAVNDYLREMLLAEKGFAVSVTAIGRIEQAVSKEDMQLSYYCKDKISRCRVTIAETNSSKKQFIWFSVNAMQSTITTKKQVRSGDTFRQSNTVVEIANIFRCKEVISVNNLQPNMRFKRDIKMGRAICRADLELLPDVQKNMLATLLFKNTDFDLSVKVDVFQDANIGDSIEVRVPGSSKMIMATVVNAGILEVANDF